jgi:translocation and assembly module TamB
MLQLANGSLALRKNRLTYPSVAAKIFFNQQQIDIRELFLKTNGEGYLRGSGQVDLEGTTPTRCKLTLEGKDFFIPFQKAIEARVSPSLTLSGPMDALSLTGQVTIDQGKINLDRLVPQTPPDIQIVGAAAGGNGEERIAEEAPAPAFFRQLGARVRVKAPRNVWLKGQDLSTEIGGDLTLNKKPGESFRLLGELRTLRGFYYFQGRRFSVRKGTVNFIGLKEPNPGLDIEADAKIQDALIKVLISGTARQLVLTLDSEPKMDKSDIISYLVFGKPTDSLRGGGAFNVEKAALGFTGSLVASEMRRLLGDVFFLDSFSIESGENGGLGAVSLGKYLRPDLYVSYQYTAGEEKTSEVDVSYEIDPNLRLETQLGNDRTSGADLFWEFDY